MLLFAFSICVNAQSVVSTPDGKYPVYCDIMAYNAFGIGKVKVRLDMGHKVTDYESLFDENDKKIKFNTIMEAVNYMAKRGWSVAQTYPLTDVGLSKQTVIHYLLVKYVTNDSEISEGLKLKVEE